MIVRAGRSGSWSPQNELVLHFKFLPSIALSWSATKRPLRHYSLTAEWLIFVIAVAWEA